MIPWPEKIETEYQSWIKCRELFHPRDFNTSPDFCGLALRIQTEHRMKSSLGRVWRKIARWRWRAWLKRHKIYSQIFHTCSCTGLNGREGF
jgi:hypothetical protein